MRLCEKQKVHQSNNHIPKYVKAHLAHENLIKVDNPYKPGVSAEDAITIVSDQVSTIILGAVTKHKGRKNLRYETSCR